MLVVTPVTAAAAGYFLDGPATGRWVGAGCGALGLDGPVAATPLRRVLAGRHPATGTPVQLRRVRGRRAGWDLTFAAPKSVSLLAAHAGVPYAGALVAAHAGAVDDAIRWLTARGCRIASPRLPAQVPAVVAARFDHGVSDGGDPHLHTHLLLANLGLGSNGHWACLASSPLWPSMRPLGGIYRLAMRARLEAAGLQFEWRRTGPDGLADIAGVPRGVITAWSARSGEVGDRLREWDDQELAGRAARRAVRGATRRRSGEVVAAPVPGPVAWGPDTARRVCEEAAHRASRAVPGAGAARWTEPGEESLSVRAADWLAARGSTFTGFDVVRAVAAVSDHGLTPEAVDRWAARFCADADPFRSGERWTTPAAALADRSVLEAVGAAHAAVPAPVLDDALAAHRLPASLAGECRRLVTTDAAVVVVAGTGGRSRLLEQAAVIAAARAAWEGAGHRVGLDAPMPARRRWDALAGVRPAVRDVRPPAVVVVDRADRRSSDELRRLAEEAARASTKLVLVEGGTLPARHHPASAALAGLACADPTVRRRHVSRQPPLQDLQPAWPLEPGAPPVAVTVRPPVAGDRSACVVGVGPADTLAALVGQWARAPAPARPLLVGLGPAEVEALNAAARRARQAAGELGGPALRAGAREYQAGDAVVTLRRLDVAAGTLGTVVSLDPAGTSMTVDWAGTVRRIERHDARHLGHGYAVTPARVPSGREVIVLGDPALLRSRTEHVLLAGVAATTARLRLDHPLGPLAHSASAPPAADLAAAMRRPVADLQAAGSRLAGRLLATAPLGPLAPLGPGPSAWVAANQEELTAWRCATQAAALRADALARVAALSPHLHCAGPRPETGPALARWEAAVQAAATALDLAPRGGPVHTPERHRDAVALGLG